MSEMTPRESMIAFVKNATARPEYVDKATPWTFQVQATLSELKAGLGSGEVATTGDGKSLPWLAHQPSTIAMIALFKDAVRQPEFVEGHNGQLMMNHAVRHPGARGLEHLMNTFGATQARDHLLARIPGLEVTVPEFNAYLADPRQGMMLGRRQIIAGGRDTFNEQARPLAAEEGLNRLMRRIDVYLSSEILTRAVHLDPEAMIRIIKDVPRKDMDKVHQAFEDMKEQNARRVQDRFAMRTIVRSGRLAVDKAYGIPRSRKTKEAEDLSI